ncbi:OmpP1/FadL family transporter [Candidatus Protochlamydia phocaeensis]|uniref:OmpP1/FadL family transporter n=1 Tax=Candidatus Protochlamydia phocaeensis TaxID=1414722 RepID=UPI0008391114|nr:outer membrane protein transport protein [Candidatus Protochlamydia phocaeensis]
MQKKFWRQSVWIGLTILATFLATKAEATFASTKALGMAAANTAAPQDSLIVAYNPAGITEVGDRFDLGINYIRTESRAKVKGSLNPLYNGSFDGAKTKEIFAPEFGLAKALPYRLSAGLAVYNSDYLKTKFGRPVPILGTTRAGLEYVHETVAGTIAWQVDPCQTIGISINYMVQRFKIEGVQNTIQASAFPTDVTNRGYNYSHGVGFTLGWLGHFTRYFSIGISYRPRTHMSRFHKYKGFFAERGRLDISSLLTAGIAFHPFCFLTLTFDVQHINWRENRSLRNKSIPNVFIHPTGSRKGPGFDWTNQTFYRAGIAYAINDEWTVRAGYRYAHTSIRARSTLVNIPTLTCTQSYVTMGATWSWNACSEISAFVGYGFKHSIKGKPLPAIPFGGGRVDLEEQKMIAGISLGQSY